MKENLQKQNLDCKINCCCRDCIIEHRNNGCDYGKPEIDDYVKECDCENE